jgi:ankyrin repeat protein
MILVGLETQKDINSYTQTNVRLYHLANSYLYRYNVEHGEFQAIMWAAETGHQATAKMALAAGADPEPEIPVGWQEIWNPWRPMMPVRFINNRFISLLMLAASQGHEDVVRLPLATERVSPEFRTRSGEAPLSVAAQSGHGAVVRLLVATKRVDATAISPSETLKISLYETMQRGHEDVIILKSPLHMAMERGHEDVIKLLLAEESVQQDSNRSDGAILVDTARNGYDRAIKIMLALKPLTQVLQQNAMRMLEVAAELGHDKVVQFLLEK